MGSLLIIGLLNRACSFSQRQGPGLNLVPLMVSRWRIGLRSWDVWLDLRIWRPRVGIKALVRLDDDWFTLKSQSFLNVFSSRDSLVRLINCERIKKGEDFDYDGKNAVNNHPIRTEHNARENGGEYDQKTGRECGIAKYEPKILQYGGDEAEKIEDICCHSVHVGYGLQGWDS